jgi:hypothetical protein
MRLRHIVGLGTLLGIVGWQHGWLLRAARHGRGDEQHRQELRESLERLQSYLVPRMPYLDAMALANAGARADADIDDVLAQGRRASTDCRRTGAGEELQCTLAKVQATRSWHRMDHCTHIDFLPF